MQHPCRSSHCLTKNQRASHRNLNQSQSHSLLHSLQPTVQVQPTVQMQPTVQVSTQRTSLQPRDFSLKFLANGNTRQMHFLPSSALSRPGNTCLWICGYSDLGLANLLDSQSSQLKVQIFNSKTFDLPQNPACRTQTNPMYLLAGTNFHQFADAQCLGLFNKHVFTISGGRYQHKQIKLCWTCGTA